MCIPRGGIDGMTALPDGSGRTIAAAHLALYSRQPMPNPARTPVILPYQ